MVQVYDSGYGSLKQEMRFLRGQPKIPGDPSLDMENPLPWLIHLNL